MARDGLTCRRVQPNINVTTIACRPYDKVDEQHWRTKLRRTLQSLALRCSSISALAIFAATATPLARAIGRLAGLVVIMIAAHPRSIVIVVIVVVLPIVVAVVVSPPLPPETEC